MRSRRIALLIFVIALQFSWSPTVLACPYCAYSPHGWGFCRDGWLGFADCDEFVADDWTGRTDCDTCGSCGPDGTVPCGDSNPRDPLHPTATVTPCGGGRTLQPRFSDPTDLTWVGARADEVAMF